MVTRFRGACRRISPPEVRGWNHAVFQLNRLPPRRRDPRGKNWERWSGKRAKERREEVKREFSFPALNIKVELTANS